MVNYWNNKYNFSKEVLTTLGFVDSHLLYEFFLLPQDHFLRITFPNPWAQVWILMYSHCLSKHIHEEMIQENDCGELTRAKLETAMSINIK